jgi:hypothetical protein
MYLQYNTQYGIGAQYGVCVQYVLSAHFIYSFSPSSHIYDTGHVKFSIHSINYITKLITLGVQDSDLSW